MNGTSESQMAEDDDDLFGGWFEQSDLGAVPDAAPYGETKERRSRFGVVIAAVSAAALTLVLVFAGRI